jgi:1-acyl-sn-glycerol-3-phosphate acyltransferase
MKVGPKNVCGNAMTGNTFSASDRRQGERDVARIVAEVAEELALELQPHRRGRVRLDADAFLERDLGLDSLGRVEFLHRVAERLDVVLPDDALTSVERLGDVEEVVAASVTTAPPRPATGVTVDRSAPLERITSLPLGAGTLVDVLDWHVLTHPDRPHVCFIDEHGSESGLTYRELRDSARSVANALVGLDLEAGQAVALMLPTGLDFFTAFFGILLAGGVPVPIYPPARLTQIEEHMRRQASILDNAQVRVLVTVDAAKPVGGFLRARVPSLSHVVTAADLARPVKESVRVVANPGDLAFLQYTSGSTGDPKGVMLTHANLLANIRAMGNALQVESTDVFVSWLPLYHDMGLIGAWLGSLYHAVRFVVMSPLTFLSRPECWLQAIHRYRGTLSAAPNFAYDLCVRRVADIDLEGLDLSSWRVAANGAEPVTARTLAAFQSRFGPYGFAPATMKPVYGLAECSVGLAFPPLAREPLIDRIDRHRFALDGEAVPAETQDPNPLVVVACGRPLPRHEIRVVDSAGRELPDRREGRLQFRGPSATSGYYRNPSATAALFDGDWLESGDLAYTVDGDAFVTGRSKDLIIKAGRNIYAQEIERATGEVPGIRIGCVAAFGVPDERTGTERLVIMAETREVDAGERDRIRREIEARVLDLIGTPADDVALVPPQSVLKTSSGKIRRAACRAAYLAGGAPAARAVWWQFARMAAARVVPGTRRVFRRFGEYAYAAWWWLMLGIVAGAVWPIVSVVPAPGFCRAIAAGAGRIFFALVGIRVRVSGNESAAIDQVIIAANHSSYLDGLTLFAALDGRLTFVAKKELSRSALTGPFLAHLGTVFVERFDARESVADSATITERTRSGDTLVFFPEGTFRRMAGLLPFRTGAFAAAVASGRPVVPVAIRGTRAILRADSWFPRRRDIDVAITPPITAGGTTWGDVVALRDAVRARLLDKSGEPDLIDETELFSAPRNGAGAGQ